MARSGYLPDDLLVGRGLELVGGHVAKGAVQPGAVVQTTGIAVSVALDGV